MLGSHFERLMGAIQGGVDSVGFSFCYYTGQKAQPCARPAIHLLLTFSNCPKLTSSLHTQLTAQTQRTVSHQSSRVASSIASADAEIARYRNIICQIDELETEFDKVRHIRDIVKGFRARVEGLERRVDGRGHPASGRGRR